MAILDLKVPHQETHNWCWAATGYSIRDYYSNSNDLVSQCEIATECLDGRDKCCPTALHPRCWKLGWVYNPARNQEEPDNGSLQHLEHFQGYIKSQIPLIYIQHEIDACRPIVIAKKFNGIPLGVHFYIIYGYDDADRIYIADSFGVKYTVIDYNDLIRKPRVGREWHRTFLTQR